METRIELSDGAKKVLQGLQTLPGWGMAAIARGLEKALVWEAGRIQERRLTGKGPYPVEQHRLGEVTKRLRDSVTTSAPTVSGNTATGGIGTMGSAVKYAAIHEYGGTIRHKPRTGTVRLRTTATGALLRQGARATLAVFAGAKHKRAVERTFTSREYEVEMPARAPFGTQIAEDADRLGAIISRELLRAWEGQR